MENPEAITAIKHTLQDLRRDALTRFMGELIPLLRQEGYTYEDLLIALINWTDQQLGFTEALRRQKAFVRGQLCIPITLIQGI